MIPEPVKRQIELQLGDSLLYCEPICAGHVNRLYLIILNNKRYVLKLYAPLLPEEKILPSVKIQEYLAEKGISPGVVFYSLNYPAFLLQEYISPRDVWSFYLCGELLGKMHLYLSQYTGVLPKRHIPDSRVLSLPKDCLSERQRELLKWKLLLCNKVEKLPELDMQIIHGDYHSGNILGVENAYYAVDFDESKIYFRVYDVVKVIISLIRCMGFLRAYDGASAFLSGYGTYIQLSVREIERMLDVYAYTLGRDTACLDEKRYCFSEEYLKERIALHTFLFNEFDRIQGLIGRLMLSL